MTYSKVGSVLSVLSIIIRTLVVFVTVACLYGLFALFSIDVSISNTALMSVNQQVAQEPKYHFPSPVDTSIFDNTTDACVDFYQKTNGNYDHFRGRTFDMADAYNRQLLGVIDSMIIEGDASFCYGVKCSPVFRAYEKCMITEPGDVNHVIDKAIADYEISTSFLSLYGKIGYAVKHGYLSPVYITVDHRTNSYHLRPAGLYDFEMNIFQEYDLFNFLEGAHELNKRHRKRQITWEAFTNTVGAKATEGWNELFKVAFGRTFHRKEKIWIEHINFFSKLSMLLSYDTVGNPFLVGALDKYIKQYIKLSFGDKIFKYGGQSNCLDMIKHYYPATMCKLFLGLQHREEHDDYHLSADKVLQNVRDVYNKMYFNETNDFLSSEDRIHFARCSSLFSHVGSTEMVMKIEQTNIDAHKNIFEVVAGNFLGDHHWKDMYNPLEMHYAIPSHIDSERNPLSWLSTVNAWFDPYHGIIVIPPGIVRPPIFSPYYDLPGQYSMLGMILSHEITHTLQERFDPTCILARFNGGMLRLNEDLSDVNGLRVAYYSMKKAFEPNEPAPKDYCNFFIGYSQLWTVPPGQISNSNDEHSDSRTRVNTVTTFLDQEMTKTFNSCFKCKREFNECNVIKLL